MKVIEAIKFNSGLLKNLLLAGIRLDDGLVQFQIDDGELVLSAYQRSSDANLGLPADIYHLYLMARQIDLSIPRQTCPVTDSC